MQRKFYSETITLGIVLAVLASLMFSLKPVFIKKAYELGANSETLMLLRMWFSAPFYAVLFYRHTAHLKLLIQSLPKVMGIGFFGYFLSSYLDFIALETISAHAERLILYAYPSLVVVIKACVDRCMPSKELLFATLMVYIGIVLLIPGELQVQGAGIGIFLMFLCALTFALYLVVSKPMIDLLGIGLFTSSSMLFSIAFTQLHFIHIELQAIISLPPGVYVYALALAVFCTVIPSYALSAAIQKIGAQRAAIIGGSGPVFTTIFSTLLFKDLLSVYQLLGMMAVILGVFLISFPKWPLKDRL